MRAAILIWLLGNIAFVPIWARFRSAQKSAERREIADAEAAREQAERVSDLDLKPFHFSPAITEAK